MLDTLTRREVEILALCGTFASVQELADHLFVERNTVATHLNKIYSKLGVKSRHQAISVAYERGLLHTSEGARDYKTLTDMIDKRFTRIEEAIIKLASSL